jgi:GNAT superfamily N-acetyltransferase
MSEYAFDLYKNSDADEAIDLFSRCYGKTRPRDEWLWQYHSCPHGQKSIVCRLDDQLAAFYGVILRPLFIHHEETMVGHVIDVMTHPDHRGKGLFTRSAKAAFSASKSAGIGLFFGWPNQQAFPGHMKVNWSQLGKRDILRRSPEASSRLDEKLAIERVSWSALKSMSRELNDLFSVRCDDLEFVADRRSEWLNWRYALRPRFGYFPILCRSTRTGSLEGWGILRTRQFEGRKVGHIVDYLTRGGDDVLHSIESWASRYFASEGCAYAQCLDNDYQEISPSTWQAEEGRKLDLIIRSTDESGDSTPQTELDDWYLTLGDCDVF